jgi:predicted transcriptional regulator
MQKKRNRKITTSVRLSPEILNLLEKRARELKTKKSRLIRQALETFLTQQSN